MEQSELLLRFVATVESLVVPYFITGSVATTYYGEPRFTNDIAVVVALSPDRVRDFVDAFPSSEFYISEDAARDAASRAAAGTSTQFNIIHPASGLKVDIMVPADNAYNRSRFARVRREATGSGTTAAVASPEDVILKKLEYFREGRSEKHLRDIAGVLAISRDLIDLGYIDHWAAQLGVAEYWARLRP